MELLIENVSKTYPNGVRALDRVSLRISTGMFGLLGPNGAGKSTLMRIVAALQLPDEGRIIWNGSDITREPASLRAALGYLPQDFGFDPKTTAEDMLAHFATLKGISDRHARRSHVDALLEYTNLASSRKTRLGAFSGGMMQRFGIAVALLGDPQLIIVDEPTAGLDPEERNRFYNLLSELGENVIVILSTHIVEDIRVLCSSMAILNRGRVLLEATPAEAVSNLRGSLWRKEIPKSELNVVKNRYNMISTKLSAGRSIVHVRSAERPDQTFAAVEPDLEDVYFAWIKADAENTSDAENGREARP